MRGDDIVADRLSEQSPAKSSHVRGEEEMSELLTCGAQYHPKHEFEGLRSRNPTNIFMRKVSNNNHRTRNIILLPTSSSSLEELHQSERHIIRKSETLLNQRSATPTVG